VKRRLAMLGNSVVPQIPYLLGLVIAERERRLRAAERALTVTPPGGAEDRG
jgi:hypothetical protein